MPVRSFIPFDVKHGMNEEFERVYREGEFMERARIIPGFLGGDLVCIDRDAGRYAATALWDCVESYQRWQEIGPAETPVQWRTALLRVVTHFEPGAAWEVVGEVSKDGPRRG